jgi:hypothetical protein
MNTYLVSIHPLPLSQILNGTKTLEIRKHAPKPPFIAYGYCTYNGGLLQTNLDENKIVYFKGAREIPLNVALSPMNGLVVCKFVVDKVDKIDYEIFIKTPSCGYNISHEQLELACLSYNEIENYGKGFPLYAWHISQLEVFDEPMQIGEFYTTKSKHIKATPYEPKEPAKGEYFDSELLKHSNRYEYTHTPLTKAPQSYQRVEVRP